MALVYVPGRGYVSDQEDLDWYGELTLPDQSVLSWGTPGIREVPWYDLPAQFSSEGGGRVQWEGGMGGATPAGMNIAPGYINQLLQWADAAEQGQLKDYERQQWEEMRQQALAVPVRDVQSLRFDYGVDPAEAGAALLGFGSPDLGAQLLGMRARIASGTATPHERALFEDIRRAGADWNYRASVPQASDAFNPLGNELFGALAILGTGATAGLAAAPLFAGGAGLATTLGSLGTLAGTAGGWASTIGGATGQDWLSKLGLGLSIGGGLAGGLAGLGGTVTQGVTTLTDAARLASQGGKVLGALSRIPGAGPLQQPARYLGLAGQLGQAGAGVQGLLGAAGQASQAGTGGQPMSEWDYSWDYGGGTPYDNWSWDAGATSPDYFQSDAYKAFTGWGDPYGPGSSGDTGFSGEGSGWLNSILGSLGGVASGVGSFLGNNSSWLGPAVSGLAGLGTGLLGSRASSDAAALQAAALNRGIDLQTAQWLQQQANQAPWLQAGQQALGHMAGRSTWDQPTLGQMAAINPADYRAGLPGATPGWSPQSYAGYTPTDIPSAAGYRYAPGQGPQAAAYRYTPGAVPDADQFAYRPGAVPTLSGAQLLANDPGYQFRMDEARRALEASAAARGGLTSGATLSALQRQSQDLASNEYANAWNRAAQQAQMREGWAQTASQMGFGQQMQEAQLREQINQIASQQGWSQAQAEAAFREQLASQASAQNWGQALQEAQARAQQGQFGWQAGFQAQQQGQRERQQYDTELYQRMMALNQLGYGRDLQANEQAYQRMVDAYNAQRQGQTTAWNQFASLANLGQTATSNLGTGGQAATSAIGNLLTGLGNAQAGGALGSGQAWLSGLGNLNTSLQGSLQNANFANQLQSLLAGLNR